MGSFCKFLDTFFLTLQYDRIRLSARVYCNALSIIEPATNRSRNSSDLYVQFIFSSLTTTCNALHIPTPQGRWTSNTSPAARRSRCRDCPGRCTACSCSPSSSNPPAASPWSCRMSCMFISVLLSIMPLSVFVKF